VSTAVPPAANPPAVSREAALRIALFVLVLVLAAGAAWGAGRLLSLQVGAGAAQVDHSQHHVVGDAP
jgi:hypothetical protein